MEKALVCVMFMRLETNKFDMTIVEINLEANHSTLSR